MKQETANETPAKNNYLSGSITTAAVFLLVFGVYLFTLTPTVDFIDSGEFAAVCATLGIAHPSGYPLFTLLGCGFSLLPIAPTTILRLNVMNALFAALGILFFILFLEQLLSVFSPGKQASRSSPERLAEPEQESPAEAEALPKPSTVLGEVKGMPTKACKTGQASKPLRKKRKKGKRRGAPAPYKGPGKHIPGQAGKKQSGFALPGITENTRWLLAAAAGLVLAFSFIYWDAATSLEVHSLHALFVSLILFTLLKFLIAKDKKEENRFAFLLALFLGLSFANHLTTVLLLPGILFLFLSKPGVLKGVFRRFLWLALPFCAGIAFYLYIPIRASAQPEVMWGSPHNFAGLLGHISGKAFRTRMFSLSSSGEGLGDFFVKSLSRLGFVSILFILAGVVTLYLLSKTPRSTNSAKHPTRHSKKNGPDAPPPEQEQNRRLLKKMFYFVILCFLCFTLYAATFSVVDNIYYYNCSVLFLVVFIPFGLLGFLKRFSIKINHKSIALLAVFLLVPLIIINYPAANKKNNYFTADFIHNLFSAIDRDAILFASDVHILIHPIYYFQYVEKLRPDIIVLPQHGLRRGWFVRQLKFKFPGLYQKSAAEIDDYYAYFKRKNRDPRLLDQKYYRMLAGIINANFRSRPIYITSEFDPNQNPGFHPGFRRIPEGLVWRLYRAGEPVREFPYREFRYRELSYPHKDADAIRHAYMFMLKERGILDATRGRFDLALKWIEQAIAVFPARKFLSDTENGRRILPNRLKDVLKAKQWVLKRRAGAEQKE